MKKTIALVVTVRNQVQEILPFYERVLTQKRLPDEIWFADAKSTDGSREVLKKLKETDARVHFVCTEQANLSCARNLALDQVTADYLVFPRLTDRMAPSYLRDMAHVMEIDGDFDMVASGYAELTSGGKVISTCTKYGGIISWKKMLKHCFSNRGMKTGLWNKMLRRDLIEREQLSFCESLEDGGDVLFLASYSAYVRKVQVLPRVLYGHLYDPLAIRERLAEEKRRIKEQALHMQKHREAIRKIRRELRIHKACADWEAMTRVHTLLEKAGALHDIPSFFSYKARKARRLLWATQYDKKAYRAQRKEAAGCLRRRTLDVLRDRDLSGLHRMSVVASGVSPRLGLQFAKIRKKFRKK